MSFKVKRNWRINIKQGHTSLCHTANIHVYDTTPCHCTFPWYPVGDWRLLSRSRS